MVCLLSICVPERSIPFTLQLIFKSCLTTTWINFLGQMEPEVKFHSVGILSSDFGEINTPLPIKEEQSKSVLFTLREGSEYRLKLTFSVLHNIVSGLAYTNIVWKAGLQGLISSLISSFFCTPCLKNALLDSQAPKGLNTSISWGSCDVKRVQNSKKLKMNSSIPHEPQEQLWKAIKG